MTSAWIFLCTDGVECVDVCGIALGTNESGARELFGASTDDIEVWKSTSGNRLTLCTRFGFFVENRSKPNSNIRFFVKIRAHMITLWECRYECQASSMSRLKNLMFEIMSELLTAFEKNQPQVRVSGSWERKTTTWEYATRRPLGVLDVPTTKSKLFQRGVRTSWARRIYLRSGVIGASPSLLVITLTWPCSSTTGYIYDLHMTRGHAWRVPNVLGLKDVRFRRLVSY